MGGVLEDRKKKLSSNISIDIPSNINKLNDNDNSPTKKRVRETEEKIIEYQESLKIKTQKIDINRAKLQDLKLAEELSGEDQEEARMHLKEQLENDKMEWEYKLKENWLDI